MTDDMHEYRAPFVEDYIILDIPRIPHIPPVHRKYVYDRDIINAMIAFDEGYTHAPGDDESLPAGVRSVVERAAADDDRNTGEYWVKYRPAPDPFADGDGYEVTVTPARIVRGPVTFDVTVDTAALAAGIARARTEFAKVADAIIAVGEAARRAWAPIGEALRRALKPMVYLTDGETPGPITDATSALAALAYAESTTVLQHPPKPNRRNAKRAYLAVKRHLPAEARERFRALPMRQFGAL